MIVRIVAGALLGAMALGGCQKLSEAEPAPRVGGRYVGVGHYPAGPMWAQVAVDESKAEAQAAKLRDDEQIIVVMDSQTGEVRQCGNFSGRCIAMNPFDPRLPAQTAPAAVMKHAWELEASDAAAAPSGQGR